MRPPGSRCGPRAASCPDAETRSSRSPRPTSASSRSSERGSSPRPLYPTEENAVSTMTHTSPPHPVLDGLDALIKPLENLYRDLHAHPELSDQEHRTAAKAAEQLEWAGCEVTTGIGGTGVVGVLRNGDGPTVMLRADMDALPVKEDTGLSYASTATATDPDGHTVPVMHACGHDMHVTWLAGATKVLARAPEAWRGTLISLFQPAE